MRIWQGRIRDMRGGIEQGESLLRTAGASGLFTPGDADDRGGEETGQVDELLRGGRILRAGGWTTTSRALTARIEPIPDRHSGGHGAGAGARHLYAHVGHDACRARSMMWFGIFTPPGGGMMRAVRGQ